MKILFLAFILVCGFWFWFAQFTVPASQWYVSDYANVLSSWEKELLTQKITSLVQETSAQLAVVFVPTINNDSIAFAATAVGKAWWVGTEEKNNGIVLLVAVEDREWFIAVWYWLEWTIPDAIAKRIGERYFPAYFRAGDYGWWISLALDDIRAYIAADPAVMSQYDAPIDDANDALWFSVLIAIIFLFAVWLPKGKKTQSKVLKTAVWIVLVALSAFIIASISLAILYVSFFCLFFLIKFGPGMHMWWGRSGFGGFGSWWFGGGGFGGFGWGWFGGGWAGGRW
jgi:uncharacterized protein